jgi:hypothetical protein
MNIHVAMAGNNVVLSRERVAQHADAAMSNDNIFLTIKVSMDSQHFEIT